MWGPKAPIFKVPTVINDTLDASAGKSGIAFVDERKTQVRTPQFQDECDNPHGE
jgi:hypothetical protein